MITRPSTHAVTCSLAEIARYFRDDHVHMALIAAADGFLVTTITRSDLDDLDDLDGLGGQPPGWIPAAEFGTLAGRTARSADDLTAAALRLTSTRQRRLAVVDNAGRLVGLLCLKRNGSGFCSDENVRQRREASAAGA
jgi:CBS-domain-containing membrane protein